MKTVTLGELVAGGESRDRQSLTAISKSPPHYLHSDTESKSDDKMGIGCWVLGSQRCAGVPPVEEPVACGGSPR